MPILEDTVINTISAPEIGKRRLKLPINEILLQVMYINNRNVDMSMSKLKTLTADTSDTNIDIQCSVSVSACSDNIS